MALRRIFCSRHLTRSSRMERLSRHRQHSRPTLRRLTTMYPSDDQDECRVTALHLVRARLRQSRVRSKSAASRLFAHKVLFFLWPTHLLKVHFELSWCQFLLLLTVCGTATTINNNNNKMHSKRYKNYFNVSNPNMPTERTNINLVNLIICVNVSTEFKICMFCL
jgi:hypothetical protein